MRSRKGKLLLCCVLVSLVCASLALAQSPVIWEPVTADLEVSQIAVKSNPFLSSELLLFRTALKRFRLGVIKASDYGTTRSMVKPLAGSAHAILAINANFFDQNGDPLGLVISRGINSQPMHKGGGTLSGVLASYSGVPRIVSRSDFKSSGVIEAIQAGPRLLTAGSKVRGLRDASSASKRSGVCIDSKQRLIIYCVSSGILGISLDELQNILLFPEIGCIDALNLDGGGSAQLYFDAQLSGAPNTLQEIYIQGRDPVPVALGLFSVGDSPVK